MFIDSDTLNSASKEALIDEINRLKNKIHRMEKSRISEPAKADCQNVINNIREVFFQTDADGKWTYLNNYWEELTGYKVDESLGKNFIDFVHPDYREINNQKFAPLIQREKEVCRHDVKYLTRSGGYRWVEVYAKLILDEDNRTIGTAGTLTDVTGRKEYEERLNLYHNVIKSTSDGILITDYSHPENIVVECNRSFEKITGFTEADFAGKPVSYVIEKLKIETDFLKIRKAFKSGSNAKVVMKSARIDGEEFWNEINIIPIKSEGTIVNLAFSIKDITKRKEAVSQIKKTAQEYKFLFETVHDGVMIFEPENEIILAANKSAVAMYGFEREEFIGKSLRSLSKNIERGRKKIDELMEKEEVEFETVQFTKDGKEIIIESKAKLIDYQGKKSVLVTQRNVTEINKAQNELRESEVKFRALTENSDDVIMRLNKERRHTYTNPAAEKLTGIPSKSFLGKTHEELGFPDKLLKEWKHAIDFVFTDKKKNRIEFQLPNGIWIDWLLIPEFGDDGEVENVITSARDISILKQTELQLERKDKFMEAVAEFATIILKGISYDSSINKGLKVIGEISGADRIYIFKNKIEPGTGLRICSQQFEWVKAGVKPEIGNPELQNIPVVKRWEEYFKRGEFIKGAVRNFPEDEREILESQGIVSILVLPIIVNGEIWGFLGFDDCSAEREWVDIEINTLKTLTEIIGGGIRRLGISRQLKDSEEKWRLLFEMAPDAYFLLDGNGNFIDGNLEAEKMVGYSKEYLIDRNIKDVSLLDEEQKTKAVRVHAMIIRGENPEPQELILTRKSGRKIVVEVRSFPVIINGKNLILGIARDVSRRIELEQNTKKSFNKLRELNELKSKFVSMVSHEFRTPLALILASADLMEIQEEKWDALKRREHLNKIQNAVEYMTGMLDEVITLNKAEAGRISFNPSQFNAHEFMQNLTQEVKTDRVFNHTLNFSYSGNVQIIEADKNLLRHIVTNLLINSIKYTPDGGKVDLNVRCENKELKIMVTDNGIGISEEDQERLFEPFYRGRNIENKKGTGLGLAMVKSAVELHKGTIAFESTLNLGTKFIVTIPIAEVEVFF